MKIAVCDDENAEQEKLGLLLSEYNGNRPGQTVEYYISGPALVEAVAGGARFDMIFLDILMPDVSGMEAAKKLRTYDQRVEIIFLTVSPDFALESYSVRARHYIVKPLVRETLFPLLDEVGAHLEREQAKKLVVRTKSGLRQLRTDHLEFCEVIGRTVYYHMSSGAVFEGPGSMAELEGQLLGLPNFLKPHRSYLVNLDYVAYADSRELVLTLESMKQIPVPRSRCGQIRESVEAYLTQKGDGKR